MFIDLSYKSSYNIIYIVNYAHYMRGKREGKMKTFFTVLLITAAVVFLVCLIFRGETPDKPKKDVKSDNPALLP